MSVIANNISDENLTEILGHSLEGLYSGPARLPHRRGGRKAALERLKAFDPRHYAGRNHLEGNVSGLSPYLRHGMVTMPEVARFIRTFRRGNDSTELLRQLTWREFFYRVLEQEGEARVLENLEPPKVPAPWRDEIPEDLRHARTGLPCVDAWSARLVGEGYLHNHERLWFGAYWVHWRKLHWKAGYRFFREHLLDGDVASNALSWQWVASTFSAKPYIMNQQNIERHSAGVWCRTCTALCPFDAPYEDLERRLFGEQEGGRRQEAGGSREEGRQANPGRPLEPIPPRVTDHRTPDTALPTVVWIHGDSLSSTDPALEAFPDAPAVFVFDRPFLERVPVAFARLAFMYGGLRDIAAARTAPVEVRVGDALEEVRAFARAHGAAQVAQTSTLSRRFDEVVSGLEPEFRAALLEPERLTSYRGRVSKFFGFWKKVEAEVVQGETLFGNTARSRGHRDR